MSEPDENTFVRDLDAAHCPLYEARRVRYQEFYDEVVAMLIKLEEESADE